MITMIAAITHNNGLGFENTLPWRNPADMQHFKQTTTGHTVLMGRKTFESIGKPLPNRHNIILSSHGMMPTPEADVATSLRSALLLCRNRDVFVIGGAQIYEQMMPYAGKLIITRIKGDYKCDAFFPQIKAQNWAWIVSQELADKTVVDTFRRI